jgi:ribosomal protein L12E/L44/L45/RPP1/RPP2
MAKLIEASGNKVDSFWPTIFAKALSGKNVADLLCGGASAAPV